MKRYVQDLSPEDRRTWRRWQAGWFGFYVVVITSLIGISLLVPRQANTELAETTVTIARRAVERPTAIPTTPATKTFVEKPRW
jgi:hypothetical protein